MAVATMSGWGGTLSPPSRSCINRTSILRPPYTSGFAFTYHDHDHDHGYRHWQRCIRRKRIRRRRFHLIQQLGDNNNNMNMNMNMNMLEQQQQQQLQLQKGIAEFYDESSSLWENIWGDHMHHGFYDPDSDVNIVDDHRSAQIRMIEEALRFASVDSDPKMVVDVGCGIGGSSRYIATKYGAKCQGITLSPVQAQRANALAAASPSLSPGQVSFQVADALHQPFQDSQFDLVWSMESGEHMPHKHKFVSELARVAAPGGTIIIVTWCHRDLNPGEESLQPWEQTLLSKICSAFYLPAWCSTADYVRLLHSLSLQDIKAADWSQYVAPFWPAVIRSALTWKGLTSLLRTGWKTIRGAMAMPLMIQGYKKGLIKFAIITCRKPPSQSQSPSPSPSPSQSQSHQK